MFDINSMMRVCIPVHSFPKMRHLISAISIVRWPGNKAVRLTCKFPQDEQEKIQSEISKIR